MSSITAERIEEYLKDIDAEAEEMLGRSGYSTDEERQELYQAKYDLLVEREEQEPLLAYADDDAEIKRALEDLEWDNFHAACAILTAYMYNYYNQIYDADIALEQESYPYLYER